MVARAKENNGITAFFGGKADCYANRGSFFFFYPLLMQLSCSPLIFKFLNYFLKNDYFYLRGKVSENEKYRDLHPLIHCSNINRKGWPGQNQELGASSGSPR